MRRRLSDFSRKVEKSTISPLELEQIVSQSKNHFFFYFWLFISSFLEPSTMKKASESEKSEPNLGWQEVPPRARPSAVKSVAPDVNKIPSVGVVVGYRHGKFLVFQKGRRNSRDFELLISDLTAEDFPLHVGQWINFELSYS
jgi:hypothetical protein